MYNSPCIENRSGMPVFASFDTVSGFHSNLFLSGFFALSISALRKNSFLIFGLKSWRRHRSLRTIIANFAVAFCGAQMF